MDKREVDRLIEESYEELPAMLQRAARYVVDNPKLVALDSMREIAGRAGLQVSVMHRFARRLGFEGYDALRAVYREWLELGEPLFAERATALLKHTGEGDALAAEIIQADIRNLGQILDPDMLLALAGAHKTLSQARHIYVLGLRSLFPAAYYFSYACNMFLSNTSLLAGTGGVLADSLRRVTSEDALIVFSYHPYATDAAVAVQFARGREARIIAVTDSTVSPVAKGADTLIVLANATPSLFPSVVPALSVAQTLVAMLMASGGEVSMKAIAESEVQLREFGVYVERRMPYVRPAPSQRTKKTK